MATRQEERLERIKAVEREYQVAHLAAETLSEVLRINPRLLSQRQLRPRDLQKLSDNLEATFLVRLFAEFEAGLRDVWANCRRRATTPLMESVMNALAGWRSVPDVATENAHAVRAYRNSLVHEGGVAAAAVSIAQARSFLCTFFSRMPLDW